MGSEVAYPLVNGVRHDFSSIRAMIGPDTIPVTGISAIEYTISKPVGDVYGTSAQRLGRTRGQLKCTGSITIYQAEWARLSAQLVARGVALMEVPFPIVVVYADANIDPITDTLESCLITNISNSHSQGNNALVVKLDLDIMNVKTNGILMIAPKDTEAAAAAITS